MIVLDPVEILDILGNENRRRILQLLSFRPFYFNEMAKRLDLGPKAVIDHLEMLERAGLIECYRDDRRRKYFRIAENIVLEVAFSPHSYGIRTYRPHVSQKISAQPSSAPSRSSLEGETGRSGELEEICSRLRDLEEERLRLRKLMEEIDSKEMLIKRLATGLIERCASDQLEAEILTALISGDSRAEPLARRLGIPPAVVEERLGRLAAQGKVQKRDDAWTI
ncbi:MAG: helix-turn-helix domain-containing protein [Methanothrix sp.]|nr:helix-turn-helix domain-containing protein [Methanothrix sp.]MDD5768718.1 helix-turn-helix domain-containing protein [Methanothrix sp.]MDI9398210.1 helix-turn-helix domain-containing protein [Euryarchaeota archaeon]